MGDDTLRRISPSDLLLHKRSASGQTPTWQKSEPTAPPWKPSSSQQEGPPDVCAGCSGAGFFKLAVPATDPQFGQLKRCECLRLGRPLVAAEIGDTLVEAGLVRGQLFTAADRHKETAQALNDELAALAHCTFESFDLRRPLSDEIDGQQVDLLDQCAAVAAAAAAAESYAEHCSGGLWLWGPTGGGKSHLAAAVAHVAVTKGLKVAYASVPSLLSHLKAGFADHSVDARRERLERVGMLILDDLEPVEQLSWDERTLFELINARYLLDGATVITSNWSPDIHAPRIASRLLGMTPEEYRVALIVSDIRRLTRMR